MINGVLGANGFLGGHLVNTLLELGEEVVAVDRGRTSPPFPQSEVEYRVIPLGSDSNDIQAIKGCDRVFYFVGGSNPATSVGLKGLQFEFESIVPAAVSVALAAAEQGVKEFYFASSAGTVYGLENKSMATEEAALNPGNPYAIGKVAVEQSLKYIGLITEMNTYSLRISNPYGPGQRATRGQGVVAAIMNSIVTGTPFRRMGGGTSLRDYIYIGDLMAMISLMIKSSPRHFDYNLASGQSHSVNDLLEMIEIVTGVAPQIEDVPAASSQVPAVHLDSTRFSGEYAWQNETSLMKGLQETWEWVAREAAQS